MIKESLDKKFGPSWHVVVGRYFAYDITYEVGCCAIAVMCWHAHPPLASNPALCLTCYPPCCWVQCKNMLYLFVGGTTGVLVWKI